MWEEVHPLVTRASVPSLRHGQHGHILPGRHQEPEPWASILSILSILCPAQASEAPTAAWPITAWLRPRHWPGPATPELRWPDPDSVCGQTQTVENVWVPRAWSQPLLFVASWRSGGHKAVRNWIITSSSSRICRDLSILLTLIPGNSSQLVKMLLYQRGSA